MNAELERRRRFDAAVEALAYDEIFLNALHEWEIADAAFPEEVRQQRLHLARVVLTRIDDLGFGLLPASRPATRTPK